MMQSVFTGRTLRALMLGLTVAGTSAGFASAADGIVGNWTRDDGTSKIRMSNCGAAVCGNVSWLKDPNSPSKIGQRVFYDMKPDGANSWSGSAFNPEDGKTYSGSASVSGNAMTTKGCAMGGLICRTVTWTRGS